MEDSHYFFKTIGLETYIGSDKSFCDSPPRMDMDNLDYDSLHDSKLKNEKSSDKSSQKDDSKICRKDDAISDPVHQVTDDIQADDFFSSLELQSSSKTLSNMISLSFPNKLSGGIVTRSRSFSSTLHENLKISKKTYPKSEQKKKVNLKIIKKKNDNMKKWGEKGRRMKTRRRKKKFVNSKKPPSDGKVPTIPEVKKQVLNKVDDIILDKSLVLEKSKDEEELILFNHLESKKELDDKLLENRQLIGHDLPYPIKRRTPELFSMSPILMNDVMEVKDDVDKLLEVDEYDDSFLEEMDDFDYAPPRTHTGGKWKPGSLSIRTSPMIWQNQPWDSLLDYRNQDDETKIQIDSPTESSSDKSKENKFLAIGSSGAKWKSLAPPATHTGGKWKPTVTPPATHTGGKWKPSEITQRIKKCDQDPLSLEDTDLSWKCESSNPAEPPVTHTAGKWKPGFSALTYRSAPWKTEIVLPNQKLSFPDSNHSRGKWVSNSGKASINRSTLDVLANCQSTSGKCLKTSGGMIQYYCSPCNRRLSSKKMYKNHVQSELHIKRVLQENELEFDSRSLQLFRGLFTQGGERGLGKRIIKKPEIFKVSEIENVKGEKETETLIKTTGKKIGRKELIRCNVCKIKIPSHQLGKHLVSYYHSRRIQLNDPDQQKLILDNIHAIVKQAPYQCSLCKFYCNTHNAFKKHWALSVHQQAESRNKRFWCSLCNFECETSRLMELHLDSNSHREVIFAVNKSIPIIIRHKYIFSCNICLKEFCFSIELNKHKKMIHESADNDNNGKLLCCVCKHEFKNMKALQNHLLYNHKGEVKVPYFCTVCNEMFRTKFEARAHRNGQLHRFNKLISAKGICNKDLSRNCSYCGKTLLNVAELKTHFVKNHSEYLPKCIKCGMVFALSQEVSQHVKNNECKFPENTSNSSCKLFCCDSCGFNSNSKCELILHTTTHQQTDQNTKKIACPMCDSLFTQTGLSVHLRTHLKEITYKCRLCPKGFVRKDRYVRHLKLKHFINENQDSVNIESDRMVKEELNNEEKKEKNAKELVQEEKEKLSKKIIPEESKCGDRRCRYVAKDEKDLEKHKLIHIGPRNYRCPECQHISNSSTAYKRHYMIHVDERAFPCPHCPFKARLRSHLKRHMRLHTGAKPYKCPHCPYSCNIMENLRKHVLNTKLHPGKKIYECKECEFDTNNSKEFKMHLLQNHGSNNCQPLETNVSAGIYIREEDLTGLSEPISRKSISSKPIPIKPKKIQPQSQEKKYPLTLKEKIDSITKKLCPIAPKSTFKEKKIFIVSQKNPNNVEDKRKILEMELDKLRKQNKVEMQQKYPRSYPSPVELKQIANEETSLEDSRIQLEGPKFSYEEENSIRTDEPPDMDDDDSSEGNLIIAEDSCDVEDAPEENLMTSDESSKVGCASAMPEEILNTAEESSKVNDCNTTPEENPIITVVPSKMGDDNLGGVVLTASESASGDSPLLMFNLLPPVVSITQTDLSQSPNSNNSAVEKAELSSAYIVYENIPSSEDIKLFVIGNYEM